MEAGARPDFAGKRRFWFEGGLQTSLREKEKEKAEENG